MNIYTQEYGKRALIKQIFINGNISEAALMVYLKMMNLYPNLSTKKSLNELSASTLNFTAKRFGNGYIIEVILTQAQIKGLSYIFVNPYKEGNKIFLSAIENGYNFSEKRLAVAKEILIVENDNNSYSSYSLLTKLNSTDEEINNVKKEDIDDIVKKIKESKQTVSLYVGKDGNDIPSFDDNKLENQEYILNEKEINTANVIDETAMIIFSNKEITDTLEKESLISSIEFIKEKIKERLKALIFFEYEIHDEILDNKHFALYITTKENKLNNILSVLDFFSLTKEEIDFNFIQSQDKIFKIKTKMHFDLYIQNLLLDTRLNLKNNNSVMDLESIKSIFSTIKEEKKIIVKKETKND